MGDEFVGEMLVLFIVQLFVYSEADFCVNPVFLYSTEQLLPSKGPFCIVNKRGKHFSLILMYSFDVRLT